MAIGYISIPPTPVFGQSQRVCAGIVALQHGFGIGIGRSGITASQHGFAQHGFGIGRSGITASQHGFGIGMGRFGISVPPSAQPQEAAGLSTLLGSITGRSGIMVGGSPQLQSKSGCIIICGRQPQPQLQPQRL